MSDRTTISSTETVASLEDAIDTVANRKGIKKPDRTAIIGVADEGKDDTECESSDAGSISTASSDRSYRSIIAKDLRIWVPLDEACNSNCRRADWMRSAEEEYEEVGAHNPVKLVSKKSKRFDGVGGIKVPTNCRLNIPTCMKQHSHQRRSLYSHMRQGHPGTGTGAFDNDS